MGSAFTGSGKETSFDYLARQLICVATGEGGTPELFCTHTRRTRFQVVFTMYGVDVYDLARHGEPMVPTFFVPRELKRGRK